MSPSERGELTGRFLTIAGVLVVATYLLTMPFSFVESVLFQPSHDEPITLEQMGLGGEEIFLETEDEVRIHAYRIDWPGATRTILFLHGNAGNASHRLPNARLLARMNANVLLLDYRGYGKSEGSPTESGVCADARAALDYLVRERGVPEERIVIFGRSLGAAVALDLAQHRPLAGVVVESGFTSLAALAQHLYRLPLGWVVGGRFDSLSKVGGLQTSYLGIHGDQDEVVPIELGRELFAAAPAPKDFHTVRGAGHNDTLEVGGRAYRRRIAAFLDEVAPL